MLSLADEVTGQVSAATCHRQASTFFLVLAPLKQTFSSAHTHSRADVDLPLRSATLAALLFCPAVGYASSPLLSSHHAFTVFFPPQRGFPVYPSVAPLASLSSECASQRAPHVLQMGALIR